MPATDRAALIKFLKTNETLQATHTASRKLSSSQKRIMPRRNLSLAATAASVLGFASLANAAIVMNGDFEIAGTGPTDALAWTGENGTTIRRTATGGVSGSAGGLISNSTPVSAAGPLTENTGFAGGDPAVGGLLYTFRFDSQRTFANGGVFQAQLVARDDANTPLGFPINVTLTTGSAGFETFSQDFTAPAGTTRFEINFFAITGADPGSSSSVVVDNIQIVPEPSTWALLLSGMGLLARRRAVPALKL
jgi:PEP-CTERM motif